MSVEQKFILDAGDSRITSALPHAAWVSGDYEDGVSFGALFVPEDGDPCQALLE